MYFVKCNNMSNGGGNFFYRTSKKKYLIDLEKSIESGLIPDLKLGIFIKEGYGALVGFCPFNCTTIEQLLNYSTFDNFNIEVINPLDADKISNISDPFGYKRDISNGAELVIGPSCSVRGKIWDKAVYCKNYKDMLMKDEIDKSNINQKQNVLKIKTS